MIARSNVRILAPRSCSACPALQGLAGDVFRDQVRDGLFEELRGGVGLAALDGDQDPGDLAPSR
jgi:hypothetical protein